MVIFAIILGLSPSFIWLYFFLKEDNHPEPKKMIFKVFVFGALFALLAVPFEYFFQGYLGFFNIGKYHFISFLALAAVEEISKFFAAFWVVKKSRFFDEPVDAMIYMITAALGFAALENFFIAFGNINGASMAIGEIMGIIIFRFIGATLLHALSSGVVGYYWAKKLSLLKGLAVASILHAIFNYLIIMFDEKLIYSTIFLIIVALFIFWDFEKLKQA
ncbi:MAG: PrsW family glutamic-type intramembrane protease [Patescibacteria group bacterium]